MIRRSGLKETFKRKAEYMSNYEDNVNPERKRQKISQNVNEQLNNLILGWINDANSRKIALSGPLIQERALRYANELGLNEFKASNGWLEKFLKRNNIVFKKMCGEKGDVDSKTVSDWKEKLPSVCEGYEPRDIFNMDETGLFFKAGKRTTFVQSGSECTGGKQAKNRVTVALCSSMTGEKLTPLVIGKSGNPRCFSKVNVDSLPVMYRNNSQSWMNSGLFEDWLKTVDKKMRGQGRNILLFVDNAPSHPAINVKNVKVVFLPANTTSVAQPLDQGIIQAFKLKYYKLQSARILQQMESTSKCGSELLKDITLLDAIYWIKRALGGVEESTIVKCFDKCGFEQLRGVSGEDCTSDDECDDDDIPLAFLARTEAIYGRSINEIVKNGNNIQVCDSSATNWDLPASELVKDDSECV